MNAKEGCLKKNNNKFYLPDIINKALSRYINHLSIHMKGNSLTKYNLKLVRFQSEIIS